MLSEEPQSASSNLNRIPSLPSHHTILSYERASGKLGAVQYYSLAADGIVLDGVTIDATGYHRRDSIELYDHLAEVLAARDGGFELPFPRYRAAPYVITLPTPSTAAVQATHVYRLNCLDPADLTAGTIESHRHAHELVALLRKLPAFAGTHMTTSGASFDDAVTASAFPVDVHEPTVCEGPPADGAALRSAIVDRGGKMLEHGVRFLDHGEPSREIEY